MTRNLQIAMQDATRLTQAGKLMEATAVIQRHLRGESAVDAAVDATLPDPDVIEGAFTVLETPEPAKAAMAAKSRKPGRKPLRETLGMIARGGMPAQTLRPAAPGPDDRMIAYQHAGPHGSREYLVFLPDPMPAGPCPVVVMLHGCTQSPQDFATGTAMNDRAQAEGAIVIYPGQPSGANMNKCWNWFRPSDQGRDGGEPGIIAEIAREVVAMHRADPGRVYVAGLSAGGAAALIVAQAYPDVFAAVGVHSGRAAGAARDVGSAFAAMRSGAPGDTARHQIPTIVFHGTADSTVNVANAHAVTEQAQAGMKGTRKTSKGRAGKGKAVKGRAYTRADLTHADGHNLSEVWLIDGAGHAWAGGDAAGSFTDPAGPDASAEMLRFFLQHRL